MNDSKSSMMAAVVRREAPDAINQMIAESPADADAIRRCKSRMLGELEYRIARKYVMLEILDIAAWKKRKDPG